MMAVRVGCDENTLLSCSPSDMQGLQTLADQFGLETILSCVQVLDQAMVRMQSSLHARTLLEVAAVRVCNLEHLDSVGDLSLIHISSPRDQRGSRMPSSA